MSARNAHRTVKTMDDIKLKVLYRQHTAAQTDIDVDALGDALGRHGYPDVEGTPIDRIADSALQADVLRLLAELAPDAEQLSRDVTALRRPKQTALPFLRRGLALAAGVGALAVLFTTMQHGAQPGAIDHAGPAQSIMSGSFEPGMESPQERIELKAAAPIFSGDFDS